MSLYNEVQCIVGNAHRRLPVNRQIHTTENITSLVGGKN